MHPLISNTGKIYVFQNDICIYEIPLSALQMGCALCWLYFFLFYVENREDAKGLKWMIFRRKKYVYEEEKNLNVCLLPSLWTLPLRIYVFL